MCKKWKLTKLAYINLAVWTAQMLPLLKENEEAIQ